jgi:hypothetical protein
MGGVLLESAGQPDDLRGEAPLAGRQDPVIGIGETSEVEGEEFRERAFGLIEASLELPGRPAQRRDDGIAGRRHRAARIAQQRLVGHGVGRDAPRREEGLGFARAQPVTRDGVGQAGLLPARERREGVRGGGGQPAGIDVAGQGRRQPAAEREAAVDPAAAAPEQLGDLDRGELVVVGQRAHHAGLVHRAQRPPRGVGFEQPRFADDAGRVLDDHGDVGVAGAGPGRQAFEPIQHLVRAVAGRGDAQGQRGERAGRIGARAAQRRQRGGQALDGHLKHAGHRRDLPGGAAGTAGSGRRPGPSRRAGTGPG